MNIPSASLLFFVAELSITTVSLLATSYVTDILSGQRPLNCDVTNCCVVVYHVIITAICPPSLWKFIGSDCVASLFTQKSRV